GDLRQLVTQPPELAADPRSDRRQEAPEGAKNRRIDAQNRDRARHASLFESGDEGGQDVGDDHGEDERQDDLARRDHDGDRERRAAPEKEWAAPAGRGSLAHDLIAAPSALPDRMRA